MLRIQSSNDFEFFLSSYFQGSGYSKIKIVTLSVG